MSVYEATHRPGKVINVCMGGGGGAQNDNLVNNQSHTLSDCEGASWNKRGLARIVSGTLCNSQ